MAETPLQLAQRLIEENKRLKSELTSQKMQNAKLNQEVEKVLRILSGSGVTPIEIAAQALIDNPLLSQQDVADKIGVSVYTVRRAAQKYRIGNKIRGATQ